MNRHAVKISQKQAVDALPHRHATRYRGGPALGVTGWSFVLPHMSVRRAMAITLIAMLPVCAGFYLLNHSSSFSQPLRRSLTAATILSVMVESGFTPAALAWPGNTLPPQSGHGCAVIASA
ncbi:MAG: hypothetical protein ABI158_02525 [Edaphobacter sp.]